VLDSPVGPAIPGGPWRRTGVERELESILSKNIWELEESVADGQASNQTREALLRAYAQQVDLVEEELGIEPPRRSRIRIREGSREGVLLVHGSTGSPEDLGALEEALFGAGFTTYTVRLPGHGMGDADSYEETAWESCRLDLENRFRVLANGCPRVFVLGFSFGAALALHLKQKPRPQGLVLLAPALFPRLTLGQKILSFLGLDRTRWMRDKLGWKGEVLAAMDSARKQDWWEDNVPVYVAVTRDDATVDPKGASFLRKRAAEKRTQVKVLDSGGHLFFNGSARDEIHRTVLDFLRSC